MNNRMLAELCALNRLLCSLRPFLWQYRRTALTARQLQLLVQNLQRLNG